MKKFLILCLFVAACTKAKNEPSREDSNTISKKVIQLKQNQNDSLQAIKDSIPTTRTDAERTDFWSKLKRSLR